MTVLLWWQELTPATTPITPGCRQEMAHACANLNFPGINVGMASEKRLYRIKFFVDILLFLFILIETKSHSQYNYTGFSNGFSRLHFGSALRNVIPGGAGKFFIERRQKNVCTYCRWRSSGKYSKGT